MATSAQISTSQNGINGVVSSPEQDKGGNSSDEEGRPRTSSSVSKTKPSSQLLQSTIDDMDEVKQKIDFTEIDHEGHHSSMSPQPSSKLLEEPVDVASSAPPSLNSSRKDETQEHSETAEHKTSVESILDRLETVRNYAEDAHSLYQQLQAHEEEPGNTEQMERVSVLISQLKQQELSYLQVLLKIMEGENIDNGQLGQLEQLMNKEEQETDDEEYSDNEGAESNDDEGVESINEEGVGSNDDEGVRSNDSMSLRAEISKGNEGELLVEELSEQQREIEALHEQRALLLRLQDQQSQLEALQSRQAHLLKLKQEAEDRLSEAEKQCDELGNVSHDYSRDGNDSLTVEETNMATEREKVLMAELEQLRRKKKQAEQLMEQISTDKVATITSPVLASNHGNSTVMKSPPHNELVDSNLQELQGKLRQIEDARHKMKELQEMVGMLQGMAFTKETPTKNELPKSKPQSKGSGNTTQQTPPIAPPTTDNLNEFQDDDEVIHLLADYENNIGKRQRELEAIKKRKEDLKQVEKMLQDIQLMTEERQVTSDVHHNDSSEDEEIVSIRLNSELNKQQQLYGELKIKTQQLKQLQQEIEKFSKGSDHDSAIADTTIATWGGSSVASALSTAHDEDPDTNDPNLPHYHVDRHTPRHPRPLRRAYSPHDDQNITIGKKIKLEPQMNGNKNTPTSKKTGAGGGTPQQPVTSVNKRSAIWPSVIFSQSANRNSAAGKVQTPPSFSCPKVVTPAPVPTTVTSSVSSNEYTLLLQQQLNNSSAMCFQLMEHQSSLLQALNQKLDTLPHIHEQMVQLHEYHEHLQGYHEYLNNAYWQLMECPPKDQQEVSQEETGGENNNEQELESEEPSANTSPSKQRQQSFINHDPFGLLPPPHPLNLPSVINSPYQRPGNPHLQTSPNTKCVRPVTRPPPPSVYPYPFYGSSLTPTNLPEVMQVSMGTTNQETQCDTGILGSVNTNPLEIESVSSLPDRPATDNTSLPEGTTTVFDKLRDTIYSEVASLIATNEDRPHYLVELFRELQLLNTDYLRQRALYALEQLVTRLLKDEDEILNDTINDDNDFDDDLPSNPFLSAAILHTRASRRKPVHEEPKRGNSQRFDYVEVIESASSVSTPPLNEEEPFASDVLGDTVIKTNKVEQLSDAEIDTTLLDSEIKSIMTNVIPLLKCHLDKECDTVLLDTIQSAIVDKVLLQEDLKSEGDLSAVFVEQLQASMTNSMEKYKGKILKDCGEDLLVDISEVLFNEIAFYRLIKSPKGMSSKDGYYHSVTSDQESDTNSPKRPVVPSLVLQSLGSVISQTLQEESESLGNNRDDDLAKTWDSNTKHEDKMVVQEDTTTTTTTKDEVITVNSGDDDIVENGYVNVNANIKSDHVVESNPLQNTNEKEANQTN